MSDAEPPADLLDDLDLDEDQDGLPVIPRIEDRRAGHALTVRLLKAAIVELTELLTHAEQVVVDNRAPTKGPRTVTSANMTEHLWNEMFHLLIQNPAGGKVSNDEIAAKLGVKGPRVSSGRRRFAKEITEYHALNRALNKSYAREKAMAAQQSRPPPEDDDSMFAFDYGGPA